MIPQLCIFVVMTLLFPKLARSNVLKLRPGLGTGRGSTQTRYRLGLVDSNDPVFVKSTLNI